METEHIKGLGNIYTFEKPFDEALVLLKQKNAKLISSRDFAYGRRIAGQDSNLSQYGSYTRESPIYSKDVSLLVLDSPLQNIELAKQAVQANKSGNYFQSEDNELFKKDLNQGEMEEIFLRIQAKINNDLSISVNDNKFFLTLSMAFSSYKK